MDRPFWIRVVLTALFAATGSAKLLGVAAVRDNFRRWGHSEGFMRFLGACEAAGAIGLWLPRLSLLAAACLLLLMLGALATHVKAKDGRQSLPAVAAIGLLAALLALTLRA